MFRSDFRVSLVSLAALITIAAAAPVVQHERVVGSSYVWRNVVVGAGGFAPGIIFSSAAPGLAYLRTDMGGAYRWEDGTGRWVPLEDAFAEGSYQGVESIAADPWDANVVYLAVGMGRSSPAAILRSTDRGLTWTVNPVSFHMGGNEDGRGLGERLAIDPNRTSILFFGSRHDGLQRSDDSGRSWHKVRAFPLPGLGTPPPGWRQPTHAGIAFVLFDLSSGTRGRGSRALFAASADPGPRHLFRSDDGGTQWTAVAGGPPAELLPVKAALDANGQLFIDYDNGIGPNGITRGAVWRLDLKSGAWTDVTPEKGADVPAGGYMGVSLDRQNPGTLMVSTVDRWHPGDTVFRSIDWGAHWQDLKPNSVRDVSISPFLKLDRSEADMGHWMAGLAIDPFNGNRVAYTTGATVYATVDAASSGTIHWTPWVRGIEQTAIISLTSPTGGAQLLSGFGDIAGFVHDDLTVSPAHPHMNPYLTNTNNLDYAGLVPSVVVRSGNGHGPPPWDATLAWSNDGGQHWRPLVARSGSAGRGDQDGAAAITVSADGQIFIAGTPTPLRSSDQGRTWQPVNGLPPGTRAVADKVDPSRFYAVDFARSAVMASDDGGVDFVPVAGKGLPADLLPARPHSRETPYPLLAAPGRSGDLWFNVAGKIYHSADGGRTFSRSEGAIEVRLLALGAPAPGGSVPTLFAVGLLNGVNGLYRSIDGAEHWARINDDQHQWGLRFRVIEGDPKRFGRVYVGTDGRGILYGDPQS